MELNKSYQALARSAVVVTLIGAVLIAILSLMPGHALPTFKLTDKIQHFAAYAMLSLFATLARRRLPVPAVLCGLVIYGLVLEAAQGLMPYGRSASWLDAFANTLGVLAGAWAATRLQAIMSQSER